MKKMAAALLSILLLLGCMGAVAEEPITIRIMREAQNIWYPEGEDMYSNVLMNFMEDELGVEFDVAWAADNGAYATQINMMIASNSLPDMFYATVDQMHVLYEYGMIQPIGQYFDEYCTPDALQRLTFANNAFFVGCVFDDQYYGFPCPDDFMGDMPMLYVRQDWLDALDLTFDPDNFTLDDFMQMCEAFTYGDPDGNGIDDTYALEFDSSSVSGLHIKTFAHALGLQANMWVENEAGDLEYTDIREETKELLALLQELYNKGYIPSDFVAMSYWSHGTTELAGGKSGIFPGYFWSGLGAPEIAVQTNPDIEFSVFPIPRNPNGEYSLQTDVKVPKYLVVNASFEHPELAVEYMQLWYDMWLGEHAEWFHGLNGNDYAPAEEDFKYYVPFFWGGVTNNLNISNLIVKALDDGDTVELEKDAQAYKQYLQILDWLNGVLDAEGNPNYYGFAQYYNFCHGDQLVERLYGSDDASSYIFNLPSVIPVNEDLATIKSLVGSLRTEYFHKIIMGADLETTFAEYVDQWYAIGGQELADYYNEWYDANAAQFAGQ